MSPRLRSAASYLVISAILIALTMTGMSGCGSGSGSGSSSSGSSGQTTPPSIASGSFKAAAPTITAGTSTTLSWSVSNATSLSIDNGVGTVTGSSVTVKPSATTTYTLTATNSAGATATAQVTVTVVAAPVIASFTATPSILNPVTLGTTKATLSWSTADAKTVSIDNGVGTVTGTSASVTPAATTTYTLTATNSLGTSVTATATVGVRNKLAVLAGVPYPGADVDGTGSAATFSEPEALAADASGNLYVADTYNNEIRKVTPKGVVTTIAGGAALTSTTAVRVRSINTQKGDAASGFLARQARMRRLRSGVRATPKSSDSLIKHAGLNDPEGIAVSSDGGTIYVSDTENQIIRKIVIASDGTATMSTFAGTIGTVGYADGTGTAAGFAFPRGIALDASGNLYVADWGNGKIRKITSAGVVTALTDASTGYAASFQEPSEITLDASNNLFVTSTDNGKISKITPAGAVSTLLRDGTWSSDNQTVAFSAAHFDSAAGIAVDASGNLYVVESYSGLIIEITPAGVISTLAGNGSWTSTDGTGTAAGFDYPQAITIDASGNIYVADLRTIRKIIPSTAVVSTLAGTYGKVGSADGTGSAALFGQPEGITVDADGSIYVADMGTSTIRKITPEGVVTTLAGTAGTRGHSDGTGSAASFDLPQGITVDTGGNLFVTDYYNDTIREITPGGVVTTLAGTTGTSGSTDGTGTAARFNSPWGIAVDVSDNVYVADTNNNTIRKISSAGVVTTLAGTAGRQGHSDGTGTTASFVLPEGIAVDASGNVYVADTHNNTIRKITSEGVVTTLAGTAGTSGHADGTGTAASFYQPEGIAVDASGNVYVADVGNSVIRKITPAGVVTTIIGVSGNATASTGLLPASIYLPTGIATDSTGNLFITVPNAVLTLEP